MWTNENVPDMTGKTVIVTGANSGIGYETTRVLAIKGATVIMACRNLNKANAAADKIHAENPEAGLDVQALDLGELQSVRDFVERFKSEYEQLDILINNAGIMAIPFQKTADGFEMQFGVNHLGHFALTGLLIDKLVQTPDSRIVTLSSDGHKFGKMNFDNLNAEQKYGRWAAYAQSKLANLLFTYELQRRLEAAKVDTIAVAAHPGWTKTNLQRGFMKFVTQLLGQSIEMGTLPTLYAATVPEVEGGSYYGPHGFMGMRGYPKKVKSSKASYNEADAEKLWEVSEELTDVTFDFEKHS